MFQGVRRSAVAALGCCVLLGCSGSDAGGSLLSNDGVWTYVADGTQHRRADLAYFFFDKDCALAVDSANAGLNYLGDPQKLLSTDEYLGTSLYAAAPGPRTLKLRMAKTIEGHAYAGAPDKSGDFQARHFYGFDCSVDCENKITVTLIDRDRISEKH